MDTIIYLTIAFFIPMYQYIYNVNSVLFLAYFGITFSKCVIL